MTAFWQKGHGHLSFTCRPKLSAQVRISDNSINLGHIHKVGLGPGGQNAIPNGELETFRKYRCSIWLIPTIPGEDRE